MNVSFKTLGLSAAVTVATALTANAALIDFTNSGVATVNPANVATGAGIGGGITWTLTSTGGNLNDSEAGPDCSGIDCGPLALDNDGFGITDDEASAPRQFFTLTFSDTVTLTSLHFLDLFISRDEQTRESVVLGGDISGTVFADTIFRTDDLVGYNVASVLATGTTFTFTPGNDNDAIGAADFAFAAFEVAPIPLPAGVLLLGGALAGLGAYGRRKTA